MKVTTQSTELTVAEATKMLEVLKPMVDGGLETYMFEPSVKGDWYDEDFFDDLQPITGWHIAKGNGLLYVHVGRDDNSSGFDNVQAKWESQFNHYIPTTDQMLGYILAFNSRQMQGTGEYQFYHILGSGFQLRTKFRPDPDEILYNIPDETVRTALARVCVQAWKIEQEVGS